MYQPSEWQICYPQHLTLNYDTFFRYAKDQFSEVTPSSMINIKVFSALKATLLGVASVASFGLLTLSSAHGQTKSDFAERVRTNRKPRLTVVISIDQFREDYLRRLQDLFLSAKTKEGVGGFNYLLENGSSFLNAQYRHIPTATGPGHAVILTGGYPATTGIVGNIWWNPVTHKPVYCVDDDTVKVVGMKEGSKATPMGAKNLRSTTVGDELKLATNGRSKVVTLALKDRAAVLLGGHTQDVSIWYDDWVGRWISSTAYAKNGTLPAWVEEVNALQIPASALGKTWTVSLSSEALKRTILPKIKPAHNPYNLGLAFPHTIGMEKTRANFRAFTLTPYANRFVFETAKRAVTGEKLGQGASPDLLAMNLSTNDYVGHAYGPLSPEATDVAVETDRDLSGFLNFLNKAIPGGLKEVLIVITADHGVLPIVEDLQERNISAGHIPMDNIESAARTALTSRYGEYGWLTKDAQGKKNGIFEEPYLTLNPDAVAAALKDGKALTRTEIEETAANAIASLPNIYACFTRSQIAKGMMPPTLLSEKVANSFHQKVSGDVLVVAEPGFYPDPMTPGPYSAEHGSPWAYDSHVPIIFCGPGINRGVWTEMVSPADIAPTLSLILGIEFPTGCVGKVLSSALK